MRELSPRAQAILDAARDGDEPSADDKARVRRAVLASLGGAAVGSASGSAAAASGVAASSSSAAVGGASVGAAAAGTTAAAGSTAGVTGLGSALLAKVLVATVAVGTVAGTATLVSWDDATPSAAEFADADVATVSVQGDDDAPAPHFEATPAEPTEAAAEAPEEPNPAAEPATPQAPAVVAAPSRPRFHLRDPAQREAAPSAPETLAEEVAMLRQAQRARGRGEPLEALRLLELHAARFPDGVLGAERAAALALTLCDLGREAQARAAADRFVATHPSSPLRARVASACR